MRSTRLAWSICSGITEDMGKASRQDSAVMAKSDSCDTQETQVVIPGSKLSVHPRKKVLAQRQGLLRPRVRRLPSIT